MSTAEPDYKTSEYVFHLYSLVRDAAAQLHPSGVAATFSLTVCHEIALRFYHDYERLFRDKEHGLHPAKEFGYLCFWIRKLKPISDCYPVETVIAAAGGELPYNLEIRDVNEQVALRIFEKLMLRTVRNEKLPELKEFSADDGERRLSRAFDQIYSMKHDVGQRMGTIVESLHYDMRYRTFGPHHLVQLGYHAIAVACAYPA